MIMLLILSINFSWFKRFDYQVFDWQTAYFAEQFEVDNDIVVISIDDRSLLNMNDIAGRWVWPRSVHGQLVEAIQSHAPQLIAFDILFSETDNYRPDDDIYFNEVIKNANNVFFAMLQQRLVSGGNLIASLPNSIPIGKTPSAQKNARISLLLPSVIDSDDWHVGLINYTAEFDGIIRFYDVYANVQGWQINSLPSEIVQAVGGVMPDSPRIMLNWRGNKEQPYKTFSYVDVFNAVMKGEQSYLSQFNDKIILIGTTASGLYDARATPLNPQLAGVYTLATAIDNMKNSQYFLLGNQWLYYICIVFALTLISFCFLINKHFVYQISVALILVVFIALVYLSLSYFMFAKQQLLFVGTPMVLIITSLLTHSILNGFVEYQQRKKTLGLFSRFLDPAVVLKLLKADELSTDKLMKKRTLTVLFSDIRNFTELSEKHDASSIVALLNEYFNRQVAIIFKQHGTLDKFIGDCVMAFWGAPVHSDSHAEDAINAALLMEEALLNFRKSLPEHFQHLDVGFGIHTGECIVGMIGADLRVDYTVIGDAVNLASRIEGLTNSNSRILVSEQTKQQAESKFDFNYLGEFQVKGRKSLVKLYQPHRRTKNVCYT